MLPLGKKRPQPLTQPKVYLSVSSEGYGHSSRALGIASQYPHSQLLIGTYGYALDRLRQVGLDCLPITQEYQLMGAEGGFDVHQTIFKNQQSVLNLMQIIAEERRIMRDENVTLVVADGRIAPVIAASQLGIPCLVMTNQSDFYPFFEHDSTFVRWFGKSFEWWLRSWLSSADEILIPDFYPPDTVCLMNLSPSFHIKKRTRFLGPLVNFERKAIVPAPRPEGFSHYVVVSLGGHSYRRPLLDAVLEMAPRFPHVYFDLLTSLPTFQLPANVNRRGHVADCSSLFQAADVVITQAGHSTAMELLTLGKPAVIVPDQHQSEQQNNALRMEALGVAKLVQYDALQSPEDKLGQALDKVLRQGRYNRMAEQMAQKSENMNGAQRTANVLDAYAHRLLAY